MRTETAVTRTSVVIIILFSLLVTSSDGFTEELFANDFCAPDPPKTILADYQASYVQHKWDGTGISHISAGTIYASLSIRRLRIDVTYDGIIASSLFDYSKMNPDGSVPNFM